MASQYYSNYKTLKHIRFECIFVVVLSLIIIVLSIATFFINKKNSFQNGLGVAMPFFFPYTYKLFIFFRNTSNGYSVSDYIESMSDLLDYSRLLLIIPIVLIIRYFKCPSKDLKKSSLVTTIMLGGFLITPDMLSSIKNFVRLLSGYHGFLLYNCLSAILALLYIASVIMMVIQINNSFSFVSSIASKAFDVPKDENTDNQ